MRDLALPRLSAELALAQQAPLDDALAEVASVGDEIEMMAWYITDLDYGLDDFPCTTLEYEVVTQDSPGPVTDPEVDRG